jgi:hypothetical protein
MQILIYLERHSKYFEYYYDNSFEESLVFEIRTSFSFEFVKNFIIEIWEKNNDSWYYYNKLKYYVC